LDVPVIAINYGRGVGRSIVRGIMRTEHIRAQQQRRIFERCGVLVPARDIERMNAPDYLFSRAIWRRQGRALVIRATCVGGKVERFLAP
jgi:hypothetical protein